MVHSGLLRRKIASNENLSLNRQVLTWSTPHCASLCRRLYVSAHRSPIGRWLRERVQERDGLRGVEGVVVRRRSRLAAERHRTRHGRSRTTFSEPPRARARALGDTYRCARDSARTLKTLRVKRFAPAAVAPCRVSYGGSGCACEQTRGHCRGRGAAGGLIRHFIIAAFKLSRGAEKPNLCSRIPLPAAARCNFQAFQHRRPWRRTSPTATGEPSTHTHTKKQITASRGASHPSPRSHA